MPGTCEGCEDSGYRYRNRTLYQCKKYNCWITEWPTRDGSTVHFRKPTNLMPAHPDFDKDSFDRADSELICLAVKLCG